MSQTILYLGDTTITTAAAYLTGLMATWGWSFQYVPSDQSVSEATLGKLDEIALIIVSDFPAANISAEAQKKLLTRVNEGAGLLMCGGWESFQGSDGHWANTPLATALPVEISDDDDRVNCDHPVYAEPTGTGEDHPILANLPWRARPPLIGGFNRIRAKEDATTDSLLTARHATVTRNDDGYRHELGDCDLLLSVGEFGAGRTAAFATDMAPHWIGPMIDWGDDRVSGQATGGGEVEVGDCYARFLKQMLTWTGRLESNHE